MSNEHDPVENAERSFHDLHVSLGGGKRIKRGAMTIEQINRRRLVVKDDEALSAENRWLDIAANVLSGTPPETKVRDILPDYLSRIPSSVPQDKIVVHNHVRPRRRLGASGFRAWLSDPAPNYEKCPCGWAPELDVHYRMRGIS